MILLDLLDSLVDAETMALMHHVVTDRKFGEAADLLSLVIVLFPLLLPFSTPNISPSVMTTNLI